MKTVAINPNELLGKKGSRGRDRSASVRGADINGLRLKRPKLTVFDRLSSSDKNKIGVVSESPRGGRISISPLMKRIKDNEEEVTSSD
jgi:hypothetical protein